MRITNRYEYTNEESRVFPPLLSLRPRGFAWREAIQDNRIMIEKIPCIYILASKRNGTLYTGVTSNLRKRLHEHTSGAIPGFTQRYHVHHLVYYEVYEDMYTALSREKQIKAVLTPEQALVLRNSLRSCFAGQSPAVLHPYISSSLGRHAN